MKRQFIDNDFDLETFALETIKLEPEYFQEAKKISDRVTNEAHQWQTYINALALFAFEQWIKEYEPDLPINLDNGSIFRPAYANVLETVCNLQIGEMKCCIIALADFSDDEITIPRTAIDLPSFVAHFYIVIEVSEEEGEAIIRGFVRYDKLMKYYQSANLEIKQSWYKEFPISLLDSELDHLLLYFNLLKPSAIPLPAIPVKQKAILSQSELETVLTKLQSPKQKLWNVLTWEQGSQLLNYSQCLDSLYQWQTTPTKNPSLTIRINEVLTIVTQQAVNTALWLQSKIDTFVAPSFSCAHLGDEKFEKVINYLRDLDHSIPSNVHLFYQDIDLDGILLRLCAATWQTASTPSKSNQKWSLLLILGTQLDNDLLPAGFKLQVSDLTEILEAPKRDFEGRFLYAIVEGNFEEKFVVTLISPKGTFRTLSPYTFELESVL